MSIELAEKLKKKFTDKFVVVDASVPELKRFAEWTGKVKTVNMNGRALVEFDGPVDIGWYDIDPAFLTVVDAPKPKVVKAEAKPAKAAAPAAKPAAAAAPPAGGKMSPMDMIRAQQAAKAGGAPAPAAPAPAAGGAKMSPMEMIRAQQAAKASGTAPAAAPTPAPVAQAAPEPAPAAPAPAPAKPAAVPTTGPDGKPLSKLDQIRMQGAAKK